MKWMVSGYGNAPRNKLAGQSGAGFRLFIAAAAGGLETARALGPSEPKTW